MQITGITSASRSQLLIHSVKIELRLCLEQANAPKKLLIQYRRESIKNKIKDERNLSQDKHRLGRT